MEAKLLVLDFTQVRANQRAEQAGEQWIGYTETIGAGRSNCCCRLRSTGLFGEGTASLPRANRLQFVPKATQPVEVAC